MSRDYRLGRLDPGRNAERVDHDQLRVQYAKEPTAGQDKRSGAEYAADLARETEWSLRRSASWRAGKPLAPGERWVWRTSQGLTVAAGARLDRPDKGRRSAL